MIYSLSMNRVWLFIFITLLPILPLSSAVYAEDPFLDIEKELEIGIGGASKKAIRQAYTARWFEPGTNFSKVFISSQGPKLLSEWVGAKAAGYRINRLIEIKDEDYAGIKATVVSTSSKVSIDLLIYVPHPRSMEARELNVIKAFALLQPPAFIPDAVEKINAGGLKGTAYFKHDEVSALFHLNKGAILNISTPKKYGYPALRQYGDLLNFERLNSKLGS